jgi:hypothetical protein
MNAVNLEMPDPAPFSLTFVRDTMLRAVRHYDYGINVRGKVLGARK